MLITSAPQLFSKTSKETLFREAIKKGHRLFYRESSGFGEIWILLHEIPLYGNTKDQRWILRPLSDLTYGWVGYHKDPIDAFGREFHDFDIFEGVITVKRKD